MWGHTSKMAELGGEGGGVRRHPPDADTTAASPQEPRTAQSGSKHELCWAALHSRKKGDGRHECKMRGIRLTECTSDHHVMPRHLRTREAGFVWNRKQRKPIQEHRQARAEKRNQNDPGMIFEILPRDEKRYTRWSIHVRRHTALVGEDEMFTSKLLLPNRGEKPCPK